LNSLQKSNLVLGQAPKKRNFGKEVEEKGIANKPNGKKHPQAINGGAIKF
jgi:hypothetical protein